MTSGPNLPKPQGIYIPCNRVGQFLFVSGVTPRRDGQLVLTGAIGDEQPIDVLREAVRLAAANALVLARNELSEGETISGIASMTCFIKCSEHFEKHSAIADFASAYLVEELGDAGIGSRAAVGVSSLPGNAPVEIQLIAIAGDRS